MEFGQLMADILFYVSCKFEMYIFEIGKDIGKNVPIAFLYVLSIYCLGIKQQKAYLQSIHLYIFLNPLSRPDRCVHALIDRHICSPHMLK